MSPLQWNPEQPSSQSFLEGLLHPCSSHPKNKNKNKEKNPENKKEKFNKITERTYKYKTKISLKAKKLSEFEPLTTLLRS